jgi:UDP-glucose 4-epimerase
VSALVLASSVHAGSPPGRSTPFETHTQDAPAGAYGAAKRQAETGIAAAFGGRLAVLRFAPVLLGPPAGNLGRLLRVSRLPLPPPLAGLDNRRSYASPGTVVAALRGAVERPIHGVVPVADAAPLATSALVAAFRAAGGAALPAWPLPRALIRAAIARLAGDDQAMALCDPFIVSTAALEAHGLRPVADSLPAVRAYAADSSGGA